MAYTALTTQVLAKNFTTNVLASLAATTVTSGAGNGVTVNNDGRTFLIVVVGATATTATVNVGGKVAGVAVAGQAVVLTTNAVNLLGPWDAAVNQPATNLVQVDFSNATAVTVGAFSLSGTS